MNRSFLNSVRYLIITADFVCINVVFLFSFFLFRQYNIISHLPEYTYLGIYLNAAWLVAALTANLYNLASITSFVDFTKLSIKSYVYFILFAIIYLFFLKMVTLSRIFILTILTLTALTILLTRFIYLGIYRYHKRTEWLHNKVIIIGYNSLSKKLAGHLRNDINVRVIGYCEDHKNIKELSHHPILGDIDSALTLCKEHGVNEIYSTIAPEQNSSLYALMDSACKNCIRFKLVPDIGFFMNRQMHFEDVDGIPVFALHHEPLQDISNRIKKRIVDVAISSGVIIFVLSWLMPLVSFFIWIESGSGIFFLQHRTGKNNKIFTCLKFRSMKKNTAANERQAVRDDERITRTGRFLRRTSLDEFPQFINVFKGEMSIVGPRPHMIKHTDEYSRLIDKYMVRQFLKPGISGWAQVNGFRGETQSVHQMKKRVEHDIWYMENWSLLLDMKIIFMTVYNMFKGEKNAF